MKWFNRRNLSEFKPHALIFPAVAFVCLLVGYGLVSALIDSLRPPDGRGWTRQYYVQLMNESLFWDTLWFSVYVTMVSTALSLIIGLVVTRLLYHYFIKNYWKLFIWIPMLVPHFVAGYLMIFFLAQSGWVSSVAYHIGFVADRTEFPVLVMDRHGLGIILTYIWKEIPFVVLMLLPVYYQLDRHYADVVRTLGGNGWRVFATAEWPWLRPVMMETGIILFAFIMAAFEIPYLLGVTYPQMLPVVAYEWYYSGDWSNRPLALAAMMCITVVILVISWIGFRLSQSKRHAMMRGS